MKIDLGKNELIHFVGIGGIGMSGLALIMNGLGYKVQGSDINQNKNIESHRLDPQHKVAPGCRTPRGLPPQPLG